MSELLLELFSEEIPAMMQGKAAVAYKEIFTKYFISNQIAFDNIEVNVGPRRLCIHVDGLPLGIPASEAELKGPKVSAPEKAIEGFCRSNNISKDLLQVKNIKGADFYVFIQKTSEQKTKDIILNSISDPISEYIWPKSMYWGDYKIKWVRPLQNILCIFDGEVVPFKYGHLIANNLCYGHRFMSPKSSSVTSYIEYKKHLEDNFVTLEARERIRFIQGGLDKIASDLDLVVKDDPYLLEEVAGLVEYPRVLVGKIDKKFLSVPSEILVSAMRSHQKYFSVFDKNGNFAPYFIFVSNIKSENEELVISGNEKVLSARLADALYFYNQDLKTSLQEKAQRTDNVIFHAKLGSLKDKTSRLANLCKFIEPDNLDAQKAALLCKGDIVSEVVDEFPTLQGVMGYYYAMAESAGKGVAVAIRDHYKPQGPNDICPTGAASVLALADKIDSLCGLILAGEKPSGSKDPFALRRRALGIIRIILENKINVDIDQLISYSLDLYNDKVENSDEQKLSVIRFLTERIKYFFKNNYSPNLISATLDLMIDPNILQFSNKIKVLNDFIASNQGEGLLEAYKRANNLLGSSKFSGSVDESAFISDHEKDLYSCIKNNEDAIEIAIKKKDYDSALDGLASFHLPLAKFLDNILVKDKNAVIANNRMLLLEGIRGIFNRVAKFDQL